MEVGSDSLTDASGPCRSGGAGAGGGRTQRLALRRRALGLTPWQTGNLLALDHDDAAGAGPPCRSDMIRGPTSRALPGHGWNRDTSKSESCRRTSKPGPLSHGDRGRRADSDSGGVTLTLTEAAVGGGRAVTPTHLVAP